MRTERGNALIESLPVLTLLFVFVSGLLVASYVLFARAWIEFQSEQALYCQAESTFSIGCRQKLVSKLENFLPWGTIHTSLRSQNQEWKVEVQWKWLDSTLKVSKQLSPDQILRSRVL